MKLFCRVFLNLSYFKLWCHHIRALLHHLWLLIVILLIVWKIEKTTASIRSFCSHRIANQTNVLLHLLLGSTVRNGRCCFVLEQCRQFCLFLIKASHYSIKNLLLLLRATLELLKLKNLFLCGQVVLNFACVHFDPGRPVTSRVI